jgi:hypothetical protein
MGSWRWGPSWRWTAVDAGAGRGRELRGDPGGGPPLSIETIEALFGRVGQALALAVQAAAPPAIGLTLAGWPSA